MTRNLVRLLTLAAAVALGGCSLIIDSQTSCKTNADCTAPAVCLESLCVVTTSLDGSQPQTGLDAAQPGLDSGAPGTDASQLGLDAAQTGLDASSQPGLDASAPPDLDAGQPGLDASSQPGLDASNQPGLDAGPLTVTTLDVQVAGQPLTAGVATTFTVTAKASGGSVLTSYLGTIAISSSDTQAVFPPSYTFVPGDHGTHTFSALTFKTSGAQTLTAKDAAASVSGTANVTVDPGLAVSLQLTGLPGTCVAGTRHTVTVAALDAYGNLATGYAGTITFTSTDTQAQKPADFTFTAGVGTNTFTDGIELRTVGARSVTVTDTHVSAIFGSASATVTVASLSKLAVTGSTGPIGAGTPSTDTVSAIDAYGNTVTSYTGTVKFSSDAPSASLPANYDFKAGDSGQKGFSVTINSIGTFDVTATDTKTATITGTLAGIQVQLGPEGQLAFIAMPTAVQTGVAMASVKVQVQDLGGNPEVSATDPVTMALGVAPTGANLTGTLTKNAQSGIATFSDLKVDTEGSYTLTASSGSLIAGLSPGFEASACEVGYTGWPGCSNCATGYHHPSGAPTTCVDACTDGNPCQNPWSPVCNGNSTRTYSGPGTCTPTTVSPNYYTCDYSYVDSTCAPSYCASGACVNPCTPNPCSKAPTCKDSTTVETYTATCTPNGTSSPTCTYPPTDNSCSPKYCSAGTCIDPCAGVNCTPNATTCNALMLTTYTAGCVVTDYGTGWTSGCQQNPSTTNCDDQSLCTNDSCSILTGCGHAAVSCDDNNACTTDSCDPASGCKNTPISCDDHDACTNDSCDPASGCKNTPINCDDGDACTTDSCNHTTGCVNTTKSCDDNDSCTTDSCDSSTGCLHAANCLVGAACSAAGDCVSGHCVASTCVDQCHDTITDGNETDVDCGGACPSCGIGKSCKLPTDCTTAYCDGTTSRCVDWCASNCAVGAPYCSSDAKTLTLPNENCTVTNNAGHCSDVTVDCTAQAGGCLACTTVSAPLLITEVMVSPKSGAVQWFEVQNLSGSDFDLAGLTITESKSGYSFTVEASNVVAAHQYFVFGASTTDPGEAPINYAWPSSFSLGTTGDLQILSVTGAVLEEMQWTSTEITAGASLQLSSLVDDTKDYNAYPWLLCAATNSYGNYTNQGTPGGSNTACPGPVDPNLINGWWCNSQWFDSSTTVYSYYSTSSGDTPVAQFGYRDANKVTAWTWISASPDAGGACGKNQVDAPTTTLAPGTYYWAFRYQFISSPTDWAYCLPDQALYSCSVQALPDKITVP